MDKVKVTSMVKGIVGVSLPQLRFKREWPMMGATIPIDFEILQEAIFDPGFKHMLEQGILSIDDMEAKKKLGLEPDDAKEPENLFVLNEMQMVRLLKVAPFEEFEIALKKMSKFQLNTLANLAIDKEIADYDKTDLIKKVSGVDIRKGIEIRRMEKQDSAEATKN